MNNKEQTWDKAKRPKAVVCYICGQQYGTASIDIHVPQCIKKWEKVEAKKPANLRRPVPEKPPNYEQMVKGVGSGEFDIQEYNNQAFDTYNEKALVPCHNCGRTFLPDSLIRHQKGCLKNQATGKPKTGQRGKSQNPPEAKRSPIANAGAQ